MLAARESIDWAAVRRRLRFVGSALDVAPTEVEEVITELGRGNEAKLFVFVERYGQSLEWIVSGDLTPMLRKLAGRSSVPDQPRLPLGGERGEQD